MISVSAAVAHELLGRPWSTVAEQADALNRLLTWAVDMGGYYELAIVQPRHRRPASTAPLRIEQRHTRGGSEQWCAFWWHES